MRRRLILPLVLLAAALLLRFAWPERWVVNGPMLHLLLGRAPKSPPADRLLGRLHAAPGFHVTRFAADVPNVRLLRFTPAGDLLVSQSRAGRVLLLRPDANGDGLTDGVTVLLDGLDRPHGIDFYRDWLYVAESGSVKRVHFDAAARAVSGVPETIVSGLPAGGNHWSRTLRFGPDGALYVSIGSSCNACVGSDPRRAALNRYAPDGSGHELYATGLRNAVGFDWHPVTGELYATDNGRDTLGDDFPPCELDRVVRGGFYGFPFANGNRVPDPDLGRGHEADVARTIPPAYEFRPHNAPLGITFLRRPLRPELQATALVALHGSWNRTRKDGYKVVALHWRPDGAIVEEDFLTGFLEGEDVIGRPVDVAEGPDGSIYVSDDYGGSILRVTAGPAATSSAASSSAAAVSNTAPTEAPPLVVDADTAARGRRVYQRNECALCHDRERAAKGVVVKPLVHLRQKYAIDSLIAFLKAPQPPMPPPAITDDERQDLAAYLLSRD